jgi:hypothetical protein
MPFHRHEVGQARLLQQEKCPERPRHALGVDMADMMGQFRESLSQLDDSIGEQERYLCAAKIRMEEDMPHYSDANFTMRLSYGQVGGYNLGGTTPATTPLPRASWRR